MKRKKNYKFKNKFNNINIFLYIIIAFVLLNIYPFYRNYIHCFTDDYKEIIYDDVLSLSDDYAKLLKESHEIFKNDINDLNWYVYNFNYREHVFPLYDSRSEYYLPVFYTLDEIKSLGYPLNKKFLNGIEHEDLINNYLYYEYYYDIFSNDVVDYEDVAKKILLIEAEALVESKRDDITNVLFDKDRIIYIVEFISIILILIYLFNLKFVDYKNEIKNVLILFLIIYLLNFIYEIISCLLGSGSYVFDFISLYYPGFIGNFGLFGFAIIILILYGIKILLNFKKIKK